MSNKRYSYCRFTIEEEKQIIQEYQDGNSMATLGRKYSCDPTTIKNILKAYNIQSRTLSQARNNYLQRTLDENVFENIDNPNKAYWLGVMYSDGYIGKTNPYTNYFGLSVSTKDKKWLEKFKTFLNYNGNINDYFTNEKSFKPGTPYSRLLIGNNKIVSDLEKWGVVEHKTTKIKSIPKINYIDDFIRGYIDGDGSLKLDYPHFAICGNFEFLNEIANYFQLPYHIYKDKSIYGLHYNLKESEYLEKRLYANANYYLDRKYNIAKRSFNSPLTLENVKEKCFKLRECP